MYIKKKLKQSIMNKMLNKRFQSLRRLSSIGHPVDFKRPGHRFEPPSTRTTRYRTPTMGNKPGDILRHPSKSPCN